MLEAVINQQVQPEEKSSLDCTYTSTITPNSCQTCANSLSVCLPYNEQPCQSGSACGYPTSSRADGSALVGAVQLYCSGCRPAA
jgi:hypothetical protein